MRILLLCAAAVALAGCATISTDLDAGGSPKYKTAVRSTGTNMSRRFDAINAPSTKALGEDDIQRLFRPGGNGKPPGTN